MDNKQLNEKESLELIASMIQNTHRNLESHGGKTMLVNGYITLLTSLAIYFIVGYTRNPYYFFLWFIIPVAGGILGYRNSRLHPQKVTTYIDRVVRYIWLVIGLAVWLSACAAFFKVFGPLPILFLVALMINIATTITGLTIQFKALTVGGVIGILLSFSLLLINDLNGILIFAAIFLFCMIIPGHILMNAEKKETSEIKKNV